MMPRRKTNAKLIHNARCRESYRKHLAARRAYQKAYYGAGRGKAGLLFRDARRRARENGMPFSITLADITVPERCPLLDIVLKVGSGVQTFASPTLDRIENSKGYVPGNVWVISHRANRLKGDATPDELTRIAAGVCKVLSGGKF